MTYDKFEMSGRIMDELARQGRSMREVSLAAGLGHDYVNSVLNGDRDPTVGNLVKVCNALGVSFDRIAFGADA